MIHVDGLGHAYLLRAIERGCMPFTRKLIEEAAHAFGPDGEESLRTLRHIDSTFRLVAEKRREGPRDYDS